MRRAVDTAASGHWLRHVARAWSFCKTNPFRVAWPTSTSGLVLSHIPRSFPRHLLQFGWVLAFLFFYILD